MQKLYQHRPTKSTEKRPRHETAYASRNPVVQMRRALKRWHWSGGIKEQGKHCQRQQRVFEMHVAGCTYREIATELGFRAHSHLHAMVQRDRDRVMLMARFGDDWLTMRDLWDLFEEHGFPEIGAGCSLPKVGRMGPTMEGMGGPMFSRGEDHGSYPQQIRQSVGFPECQHGTDARVAGLGASDP